MTKKEPSEENGVKYDQDPVLKPMISLVPLRAMWEAAKVMSFGAKKYNEYNWLGGIKYSRLIDAAFRHLIQFTLGEDIDPESGQNHLSHCICCLSMLLEMTMDRPDLDNRYDSFRTLPWVIDKERMDAKKEEEGK